MIQINIMRLTAAGALLCSAFFSSASLSRAATFSLQEITTWIGPDAGPGISQGALVIQWPGQTPWAWGYRWASTLSRNGQDVLLALAGADPRFSFTGSGFVGNLRWDANLDGTPEFVFPGFNETTGEYLNYFVNNAQQAGNFNDGAAPAGAHVLPPPGSPYDESGPGNWFSSNTGVLGRPFVDGSWDGWIYSNGEATPVLPVNAPVPIPESSTALLLMLAAGTGCLRHRR